METDLGSGFRASGDGLLSGGERKLDRFAQRP